MKFIIHYILLLFLIPVYSLGQEPIVSLLNYNMLSIGNSKFFLGEHKWSLKISNQDTSLFMRENSFNDDNYIFFDLNDQISNFIDKNIDIELKKDNRLIFQRHFTYPMVENQGFHLEPFFYKNKSKLRGEIIDSYRLKAVEDEYIVVRTNYISKYDCWYLLKNNIVINIHTDKIKNNKRNQKIIVSDINEDGIPEFCFFHLDEKHNQKMIILMEKEKFIAVKKENTITYSSNTMQYSNLSVRGFLHYTLK